MRECEVCGTEVFRPTGKGKWPRWCPPCKKEHERLLRSTPERKAAVRARANEWYHANKERAKATARSGDRRRSYGLSDAQYDAMLDQQKHRCAICRCLAAESVDGTLCVDHDHDTGRVRGLLCRKCNTAIGMLGDDPDRVAAALAYLGRLHLAVAL